MEYPQGGSLSTTVPDTQITAFSILQSTVLVGQTVT